METSIQRTANNNVFIPVIRKSENVSPVVVPYLVPQAVPAPQKEVRNLPFIEANTKEVDMSHLTGVYYNGEIRSGKYDMCSGLSTYSHYCTITCPLAVQTELESGTNLPTSGVTFTWVRP